MRINLAITPEQEERLATLASHEGTSLDEMLKSAALRMLREDEEHLAAIREGIEQAERGELIDHGVVLARVNDLLRAS